MEYIVDVIVIAILVTILFFHIESRNNEPEQMEEYVYDENL